MSNSPRTLQPESARLLHELAQRLGEKVELTFDYPIDAGLVELRTQMAKQSLEHAVTKIVDQLVACNDPALATELYRLLSNGHFRHNARPIVRMLERLNGADVEVCLRHCLSLADVDAAAAALRALRPYLRDDDAPMLRGLIDGKAGLLQEVAIGAAGHLGHVSLADAVAGCLGSDSIEVRIQAAITLGVLGRKEFAEQLVDRLQLENDRVFAALVVALEGIKATETLPRLVDVLRTAPRSKIWDLTHALWAISGVDPLVRASSNGEYLEELRSVWLQVANSGQLDSAPSPKISDIAELTPTLAAFDLNFGRGVFRIDFDPPTPGATWPRWGRSFLAKNNRVYSIGSTCGTCEFFLKFVDWPEAQLLQVATQLEQTDINIGLQDWIALWSPMLTQLRSGHYLVARLAMAVEKVEHEQAALSWFNRRSEFRTSADADDEDDEDFAADMQWPRTGHYQGAHHMVPQAGSEMERTSERSEPGKATKAVPTYPIFMPVQDLTKLDESRIAMYRQAIAAGERPLVTVVTWIDQRYVQAEWDERFAVSVIINGHHRLEAYVREGVAANIIAVARVEDSWGPLQERDAYLKAVFAALAPRA